MILFSLFFSIILAVPLIPNLSSMELFSFKVGTENAPALFDTGVTVAIFEFVYATDFIFSSQLLLTIVSLFSSTTSLLVLLNPIFTFLTNPILCLL